MTPPPLPVLSMVAQGLQLHPLRRDNRQHKAVGTLQQAEKLKVAAGSWAGSIPEGRRRRKVKLLCPQHQDEAGPQVLLLLQAAQAEQNRETFVRAVLISLSTALRQH